MVPRYRPSRKLKSQLSQQRQQLRPKKTSCLTLLRATRFRLLKISLPRLLHPIHFNLRVGAFLYQVIIPFPEKFYEPLFIPLRALLLLETTIIIPINIINSSKAKIDVVINQLNNLPAIVVASAISPPEASLLITDAMSTLIPSLSVAVEVKLLIHSTIIASSPNSSVIPLAKCLNVDVEVYSRALGTHSITESATKMMKLKVKLKLKF